MRLKIHHSDYQIMDLDVVILASHQLVLFEAHVCTCTSVQKFNIGAFFWCFKRELVRLSVHFNIQEDRGSTQQISRCLDSSPLDLEASSLQ